MKVTPLNGHALIARVKKNFEMAGSKDKPIFIPQTGSNASFFNRGKVLALDTPGVEREGNRILYVGDTVILSHLSAQLCVPGQIKDDKGKWIDVMLVPVDQIVGRIEDDEAEVEEVSNSPIIMSSSNQPS